MPSQPFVYLIMKGQCRQAALSERWALQVQQGSAEPADYKWLGGRSVNGPWLVFVPPQGQAHLLLLHGWNITRTSAHQLSSYPSEGRTVQ